MTPEQKPRAFGPRPSRKQILEEAIADLRLAVRQALKENSSG